METSFVPVFVGACIAFSVGIVAFAQARLNRARQERYSALRQMELDRLTDEHERLMIYHELAKRTLAEIAQG